MEWASWSCREKIPIEKVVFFSKADATLPIPPPLRVFSSVVVTFFQLAATALELELISLGAGYAGPGRPPRTPGVQQRGRRVRAAWRTLMMTELLI